VPHFHTLSGTLHNMGYRLTPQRVMVLEAVEHADSHISADEIYSQISARYPNVNISTVYRTLELLEKLGMVTKTDMGDGRVRYHSIDKGHHHHLVCQNCGEIIDFEEGFMNTLWVDIMEKYGFKVNMKHMALFGLCRKCQK